MLTSFNRTSDFTVGIARSTRFNFSNFDADAASLSSNSVEMSVSLGERAWHYARLTTRAVAGIQAAKRTRTAAQL